MTSESPLIVTLADTLAGFTTVTHHRGHDCEGCLRQARRIVTDLSAAGFEIVLRGEGPEAPTLSLRGFQKRCGPHCRDLPDSLHCGRCHVDPSVASHRGPPVTQETS